jgi:hypothetical protein
VLRHESRRAAQNAQPHAVAQIDCASALRGELRMRGRDQKRGKLMSDAGMRCLAKLASSSSVVQTGTHRILVAPEDCEVDFRPC